MTTMSPAGRRGFSLVELLVVLAIMAILLGGVVLGIRGMNDSGRFNQSLNNIAGILEQSRAYASAQDTYVWVVFYEVPSSSGGAPDVFVGSFASNDGTDPLNWAGTVTLPSPGTVGSTTLKPVMKFSHFKGLHLFTVAAGGPGSPPSSAPAPASVPTFVCTAPSDAGPQQLSPGGATVTYWVIQFTSNGGARNSANPISSIWVGLRPAHSATIVDPTNFANLEVNGLTGLCTIYRP